MKAGFSLIEVIIALLILGISSTVIFTMQHSMSRGVIRAHNLLDGLFLTKNLLTKIDEQQLSYKKDIKEEIKQPPTTLTYQSLKPTAESALAPLHNLVLEQTGAHWQTIEGVQKITVVSLRFIPEPPQEKGS